MMNIPTIFHTNHRWSHILMISCHYLLTSLAIFDKYYICCYLDLYLRYSCLFELCSLSILLSCVLQIHLYTRIDAPKVSATNPDIWQFAYTRRWVYSYSDPCLVIWLHPQFFRQFFAGFENRFSEYYRAYLELAKGKLPPRRLSLCSFSSFFLLRKFNSINFLPDAYNLTAAVFWS